MKAIHFLKENYKEISFDTLLGFSISGFGATIIPELIHLGFVVGGGLISTVVIFFASRWLKKTFPEKK
jgi:hypothetical protein